MIVDQSSQNSVSKNRAGKNSSMSWPSNDASDVSESFARRRPSAKAQPVTRPMHDGEVAIDDVRLIVERVLFD